MIILVLILLGLAFGSLVNALVWRLRQQSKAGGKKQSKQYSIVRGRSMCPHCKRELAAKDLIPVLSWLWLRGKCRYCKKSISWQYPLVEVAMAALFVLSFLVWPLPLDAWYQWVNFGVWLASLVGLMALFVYDFKWSLLPDKIIWPLVILAAANATIQFIAHQPHGNFLETVLFCTFGLLPIAGLYWVIEIVSKGRMVGHGDVKLGIFIGVALGWPGALLVLFLANVLGTLVVLPPMLSGKLTRKSCVPFGPFLITAFVIAGLWGGRIIDWYFSSQVLP